MDHSILATALKIEITSAGSGSDSFGSHNLRLPHFLCCLGIDNQKRYLGIIHQDRGLHLTSAPPCVNLRVRVSVRLRGRSCPLLDGVLACLPCSDADNVFDRENKNLTISDLSGLRLFLNDADRI